MIEFAMTLFALLRDRTVKSDLILVVKHLVELS